jgi:peptidoglycan/xylan/chitin deacetylase (PgdA/CDA1 family)
MTKKKPVPRPPRRGKQIRKRFLKQALLLLCAAGVIGFYLYIKHGETESVFAQLGQSIGEGVRQARTKVSPALQDQDRTNSSSVPQNQARRNPVASSSSGSVATPSSGSAAPVKGQATAKPPALPPYALPFAGQALEQVTREMAARYGGRAPGRFGEHMPGIVSRLEVGPSSQTGGPLLALTLDACAGDFDPGIIALLREHGIQATLFLSSRWMNKHPETVRKLSVDPLFEIAAHGDRHVPCVIDGRSVYGIKGTASMGELVREVFANARLIEERTGSAPRWFRSGTAFYDQVAVDVIHDLGMRVGGYSIAADQGATLNAEQVAERVLRAKNGDILLLHMNKPHSGTREGLRRSLPVLLRRGATFVRLSDGY